MRGPFRTSLIYSLTSILLAASALGAAGRAEAQAGQICATAQSPRSTSSTLTPSQIQQALAPAPAAAGPFDIVIHPGAGLAANPAALAAFNRAAAQWEQWIRDPIT